MEQTKSITDFAGRSVNSQSQHWCTPPKYVDAVKRVFGGEIELDPCSNKDSIVHAKTEFLLPETEENAKPFLTLLPSDAAVRKIPD